MKNGLAKASCFTQSIACADLPDLVGVDHQVAVRARSPRARCVRRRMSSSRSRPTFILMWSKPGVDRLLAEPPQLLVVIAEPARRGRVAGIALASRAWRCARPCRPRAFLRIASASSRRDRVGQVAEIDDADDLLRRHVGDQPPDRLAGLLGQQVPDGVDHRAGGQMHGALVRADPAQLAVAGQVPPEARRDSRCIQSSSSPTTRWRIASIAAQQISLPRPMVKVRP